MLGDVGSHSSLRVKRKLIDTRRRAVIFLSGISTDNIPGNNLPLLLVQATLINKWVKNKNKNDIKVKNGMLGGSVPSGRGGCVGEQRRGRVSKLSIDMYEVVKE